MGSNSPTEYLPHFSNGPLPFLVYYLGDLGPVLEVQVGLHVVILFTGRHDKISLCTFQNSNFWKKDWNITQSKFYSIKYKWRISKLTTCYFWLTFRLQAFSDNLDKLRFYKLKNTKFTIIAVIYEFLDMTSVARLGNFFKLFETIFLTNVAQIFGTIIGLF